jgi:1-acyl-sn-glycerol-3-phosphate acyltransferase
MDIFKSILVWAAGILLIVLMFPVTILIWFLAYPFDQERTLVHWWLIFQGIILSHLIPFRKIEIEGREKIEKERTYVIISNHQSILDIIIINCLRMKFRWISKVENYRVPVLGWTLRMAKYITVDRNDKDSKALMIEKAIESIRKGISIMIFPEGTRSKNMEIGMFKTGAFRLAIMTDKPVLPVIIDGTGGILPKNRLIFAGGHTLRIRILDPVLPGAFGTGSPEELSARFCNLMGKALEEMRAENTVR